MLIRVDKFNILLTDDKSRITTIVEYRYLIIKVFKRVIDIK